MSNDGSPKSSFELAMERLRKKDAEEGVTHTADDRPAEKRHRRSEELFWALEPSVQIALDLSAVATPVRVVRLHCPTCYRGHWTWTTTIVERRCLACRSSRTGSDGIDVRDAAPSLPDSGS